MKINYIAFIAFTLFNKFWTDHWQDSQPSLQLEHMGSLFQFFSRPYFALIHQNFDPYFHSHWINDPQVPCYRGLHRIRKKSAINAKQHFFFEFYIDKIAMRKKLANLPAHTLRTLAFFRNILLTSTCDELNSFF